MMDWLNISFEDGDVGGELNSDTETDENNNSKVEQVLQPTLNETTRNSSQVSSENVDVTPGSSKAGKMQKCNSCPYTSRSRGNMYRHKKAVHMGEKVNCETCSKTFSEKYDLEQHRKRMHDNMKLMCEMCSKRFNTRFSLRRHMIMVHTRNAKLTCVICSKKFYERAAYNGHVNNHIDVKPYSCTLCKKDFAFKHSMKRHMSTCGTNENTHQCEVCDKFYKTMNSLKAHRRGVHGKKEHCCPCGKSFSWPSSYARHRKTCSN